MMRKFGQEIIQVTAGKKFMALGPSLVELISTSPKRKGINSQGGRANEY